MSKKAVAEHTLLRVSPRKLNLVAGLIRRCSVDKAVAQLMASRKRIAGEVKKVLLSAVANAENNNNMDVDALYVSEVNVGKSLSMKRFRACAKGRGVRIIKPYSRMRIVVKEREGEE